MVPTFAENDMNPFFGGHTKRVLYGRKFVGKSHTKHFGQVWGLRGKILHTPKICLLLHLCPGIGQKYFCRGGQKWQNFHHAKL